MSAGVYNIEIEQGGDYALAVTYKDSAGLVFDLSSGYTALMNIKESYLDTSAIDSLTTASGEITLTSGIGTSVVGTIAIDTSKSVVTVTIGSGEHGFDSGDFINISGAAPEEYNGVVEVTSTPLYSSGAAPEILIKSPESNPCSPEPIVTVTTDLLVSIAIVPTTEVPIPLVSVISPEAVVKLSMAEVSRYDSLMFISAV
jgi:hypothetical protein